MGVLLRLVSKSGDLSVYLVYPDLCDLAFVPLILLLSYMHLLELSKTIFNSV